MTGNEILIDGGWMRTQGEFLFHVLLPVEADWQYSILIRDIENIYALSKVHRHLYSANTADAMHPFILTGDCGVRIQVIMGKKLQTVLGVKERGIHQVVIGVFFQAMTISDFRSKLVN